MLRVVGKMVGRVVGRATRLVTAGCAVVALSVVTVPAAQACACGAMVPSSNRAFVLGEAAVIRWDGRTESIDSWIIKMTIKNQSELNDLLTADAYGQLIGA